MALKWNKKVRVLAADDSQVMRRMFQALFNPQAEHWARGMPEMELCGVARDGLECLDAVKALAPDVLLLDLEMPRLHGLEVLARLRVEAPKLPTIMCSTYTERGARATLDGLARGAADYVTKPSGFRDSEAAVRSLAEELLPKIAALAGWSFMGAEMKAAHATPAATASMPMFGDAREWRDSGGGDWRFDRWAFGAGADAATAAKELFGAGTDCAAYAEAVYECAGGSVRPVLRACG